MYNQILEDKAFQEWEDSIRTENQLYQVDDEVESISLSSKTKIIFKLKSSPNIYFCYFQEADPKFFIDKEIIEANKAVVLTCWSKRVDNSVFVFVHSVSELNDTQVTVSMLKNTNDKEAQLDNCCYESPNHIKPPYKEYNELFYSPYWRKYKTALASETK